MSNVARMRVYLDAHGPERYARAAVGEYAHTFTTAVTVGRGVSRGTPVDTGEARGGWRLGLKATRQVARTAAFYAVLGAVEVDRVLKRWKLGGPVVWWNNVAHLLILAGGRRPSSTGKMIGSIQAPDGWIEQSENETRGHMRAWRPTREQLRGAA